MAGARSGAGHYPVVMRRTPTAILFVWFPIAILAVFTLAPTAAGLVLSLFTWDGAGRPAWAGLSNFRGLARDPMFWPSVRNTLLFVAGTVPATVLLAFALAVLADAAWFRGRTLVRTCIFIPTIVSVIAVGVVGRAVLQRDGGLVPELMRAAGLTPPGFLDEGYWPLASIMAVQVWRGVGFCFVLYLAALAGVNRSLYEAARVDGASRWSVVRHVTWPQVSPMTVFLLVTGVIGALQVFDIVWAMTLQAESTRTTVLNLQIYREFDRSRYGYASAIGVVIFALTLAATAGQLWVMRGRTA